MDQKYNISDVSFTAFSHPCGSRSLVDELSATARRILFSISQKGRYKKLMHLDEADSCEDDRLMAQENEQLTRELLQSQASTLAVCR